MIGRITLILLLMCTGISVAFAAETKMTRDQALLAFAEANRTFRQANESTGDPQKARDLYDQAILEYEKIISESGIQNAKLYYNLANACLLKGDLGKAILNYRRALRLDPTSPEILKNLTFARSRRADQIPVTTEKKVLSRLFFWHYEWSMSTRLLVGGVCFALLCLWLTARMWTRKIPAIGAVYIVLLLMTAGMAGSVLVEQIARGRNPAGVVIVESITARQGDGMNYPESFTEPLHAGTEFDLIQRRSGWLHIRLADGSQAWIPDTSAELI